MTRTIRLTGAIGLVGAVLAALILIYLLPYGMRASALTHMDQRIAQEQSLPRSFVVLTVPAYDGAEYFRIAQRLPDLAAGNVQPLLNVSPGAYAYQRILLPVLVYAVALGNVDWFAWSFLLINVVCLLLSTVIVFRFTGKVLPAIAIALSPSATIGLHFSTAEPLNILLLSLLMTRLLRKETLGWIGSLLLVLCLLTREVNLPLALMLFAWFAWKQRWTECLWTLPSLIIFVLWQMTLASIFGSVPFLVNETHAAIPLVAPLQILTGYWGFSIYTLSSIALLFLFVLPATGMTLQTIAREKRETKLITVLLLGYLGIMLAMPLHIWGSITSIGRAITPVYPLSTLDASAGRRLHAIILYAIIFLGLGAGLGLALIHHPFVLW